MRPETEKQLHELKEKATQHIHHAREVAEKAGRDAAHRIDEEAHKSPWIFVAVTALLTGIIGFLLGHKISKRD